MIDTKKEAILAALDKFVNQRAGMEPGNYGSWKYYRAESRSVTRDLHDYRELARYVEIRDSITGDMLEKAFSGRLTCEVTETGPGAFSARLDYCTGQYFPTEYRKAACRVLASAVWDWMQDNGMPKGELVHNSETGETFHRYQGLRGGDWLRKTFRKTFGPRLGERYFE